MNNGCTPLMLASQDGHDDVIQLLLKSNGIMTNTQNKYGRTAIYIATQRGHSSVVTLLLNNGADPNIVTMKAGHLLW
ncbi:ankyrin repeat domain-containing protein 29-like [Gigantopelta aegis]|uniref:ankyrin repeat domain-containing protein 29-like n=1 Tax=Gigantopelta aegis TaxID=1735272 RepID=UPI001B887F53|nr:ankyrin repeat domain-containing protein 29-like [Gigantopelta aegis]